MGAISYAWTYTPSDATEAFTSVSSVTTTFTPTTKGKYDLKCTVTDSNGKSAVRKAIIEIETIE